MQCTNTSENHFIWAAGGEERVCCSSESGSLNLDLKKKKSTAAAEVYPGCQCEGCAWQWENPWLVFGTGVPHIMMLRISGLRNIHIFCFTFAVYT